METKEKLILKIIQGYSPQHLEYDILYDLQKVKEICAIVWDTANNEVDNICELKAEKEILEQRLEKQYKIVDTFKTEKLKLDELFTKDMRDLTNKLFESDYLNDSLQKQNEALKAEIDLLQLEVADWESKYSNLESDIEILKNEEYERGFEAGDRGNMS
jgi:Skp family chaperone for outer membrane proteins